MTSDQICFSAERAPAPCVTYESNVSWLLLPCTRVSLTMTRQYFSPGKGAPPPPTHPTPPHIKFAGRNCRSKFPRRRTKSYVNLSRRNSETLLVILLHVTRSLAT